MFPHCTSLSRGPLWGAEPGFELGPAVQQADALLFELRRTLMSCAAPYELRRTPFELHKRLQILFLLGSTSAEEVKVSAIIQFHIKGVWRSGRVVDCNPEGCGIESRWCYF